MFYNKISNNNIQVNTVVQVSKYWNIIFTYYKT